MSSLVPKTSRDNIYRYFFTEGVLCCMKNRLGKWRSTLGGKKLEVPVIQVMQVMRQLKSRGLIKEQFAWRHYYWFLNDNGIQFMRQYLHLAESVVPNSMRKPEKEENFERRPERAEGGRGGRGGRGRGDGSSRGGRGGESRGFGRGRGEGRGRGAPRGGRSDYHADPAAGVSGGEQGAVPRPVGRGRGAPAAAPAQ